MASLPPHLAPFLKLFPSDLVSPDQAEAVLLALETTPADRLAPFNMRRAFKVLFPTIPVRIQQLTGEKGRPVRATLLYPRFPDLTERDANRAVAVIRLWKMDVSLTPFPYSNQGPDTNALLSDFQRMFGHVPSVEACSFSPSASDVEKRNKLKARHLKARLDAIQAETPTTAPVPRHRL